MTSILLGNQAVVYAAVTSWREHQRYMVARQQYLCSYFHCLEKARIGWVLLLGPEFDLRARSWGTNAIGSARCSFRLWSGSLPTNPKPISPLSAASHEREVSRHAAKNGEEKVAWFYGESECGSFSYEIHSGVTPHQNTFEPRVLL